MSEEEAKAVEETVTRAKDDDEEDAEGDEAPREEESTAKFEPVVRWLACLTLRWSWRP